MIIIWLSINAYDGKQSEMLFLTGVDKEIVSVFLYETAQTQTVNLLIVITKKKLNKSRAFVVCGL